MVKYSYKEWHNRIISLEILKRRLKTGPTREEIDKAVDDYFNKKYGGNL